MDNSALFKAMMAEDLEQLATQLEVGADINATNAAGHTLLRVAFEHGKHKSRRFLRTHGASRFDPDERRRLRCLVNNESRLHDSYEVGESVGSGGYADVFRGVKKGPGEGQGRLVAIKEIKKDASFGIEDVLTEIDMMRRCSKAAQSATGYHPNVISFYDAFDEPDNFYIVIEFMTGGDLFTEIVKRFEKDQLSFSEKEIALIFRQLLDAVATCHSAGVCHRDIKPENLLTSADAADGAIKLCDFGLAVAAPPDEHLLHDLCGSAEYCAPEMVRGFGYGPKVDVWALGVVLYILFSGCSPFAAADHAVTATFDNIVKMALKFPESEWGGVSHAATELVAAMLCRNPQERPSATALLNHRWLRATLELPDQVDAKFDAAAVAAAATSTGMPVGERRYRRFSAVIPGALDRLRRFNARRKFRTGVHAIQGARGFSSDVIVWRDGDEDGEGSDNKVSMEEALLQDLLDVHDDHI
jgi:hypothetical protein